MASPSASEFLAWFRNATATNRLETLISLLQMLHPLELRFIGTFVEELGRRDYDYLRDSERRYNREDIGTEFSEMADPICRGKMLVALCLLQSRNYATAEVLYKSLMVLNGVCKILPKSKEAVDEVLLILTLAKYHPAFRFDQSTTVSELAEDISRVSQRQVNRKNEKISVQSIPSTSGNSPYQPPTDVDHNALVRRSLSTAIACNMKRASDQSLHTEKEVACTSVPSSTPRLLLLLPRDHGGQFYNFMGNR